MSLHSKAWWRLHAPVYFVKLIQVMTCHLSHYDDVIMGAIASQITSLTIVYSIVYSDADQRKHQSSTSLAFLRGIHRGPVNSPHKGPVTRKMFPFDDVIMWCLSSTQFNINIFSVGPQENILQSIKIHSYHSRRIIGKCRLQISGPFVRIAKCMNMHVKYTHTLVGGFIIIISFLNVTIYDDIGFYEMWVQFVHTKYTYFHDDVIKWKHFRVTGHLCGEFYRSPVNSPNKGQWRGDLMFTLICVWITDWVNNREAGDLRRDCAHYDVSVMYKSILT